MFVPVLRRASVVLLAALAACSDTTTTNYPSLRVIASTAGASLDPDGYVLTVSRSGGGFTRPLSRDGSFTAARLPGTDSLTLGDVSPNCSVAGSPVRVVTLRDSDVADSARFDVTCARANGVITVRTEFSAAFAGGNVTVVVDSLESRTIAPTDSVRFTDLADGVHTLTLTAPHFPNRIGPQQATVSGGVGPSLTFDSTAALIVPCQGVFCIGC